MIIGVIPARYASTRFPGKLLADLHGKPVLQWTWEQACKAESLDKVVIAAGDEKIANAATRLGVEVVEVFKDYASGSDRIADAVQQLETSGDSFDIVVNIQGDEPLLNPEHIDLAVKRLQSDSEAGVTTLIAPIDEERQFYELSLVKAVIDKKGHALYFSRAPIPFVTEFTSCSAYKHIGLYVYRRQVLTDFVNWQACELEKLEKLEQLRLLYHDVTIATVIVESSGVGVDTEDDLMIVQRILKSN
ncbi:3-deoxy-manno-octulosonate cytidylyltransferase [bacterium]|nr:3-deoxy-manno-octulosonate cytidylyltransferase [bacterium]